MTVRYLDWITREQLRAEPEARFVFGDNRERTGYGGQAGAMRGEPNAIGVATLYAPGEFYRPDDPLALATVCGDLLQVASALGTGLARLEENAPALHRLIVAFFRAAPGEPCPWRN